MANKLTKYCSSSPDKCNEQHYPSEAAAAAEGGERRRRLAPELHAHLLLEARESWRAEGGRGLAVHGVEIRWGGCREWRLGGI